MLTSLIFIFTSLYLIFQPRNKKMKKAFNLWKTQSYYSHNDSDQEQFMNDNPFNQNQMRFIKQTVTQEFTTKIEPIKKMIMKIYEHLDIPQNNQISKLGTIRKDEVHKQVKDKTKGETIAEQLFERSEVKMETESSNRSQDNQEDSEYQQQHHHEQPNHPGNNTLVLAKSIQQWEQMYAAIKQRPKNKNHWTDLFKKNVVIFVDSGVKFGHDWKKIVRVAGISESSYKRWKKME